MKLPKTVYNWVTMIGAIIAVFNLVTILFLGAVSIILNLGSSYMGLFIYVILPGGMIFGLILIPVGMLIKHRRLRRLSEDEAKRLPVIDMNDRRNRNAFMFFFIGTIVFVFLSATGTYEAYHYSESVSFCGTLCHSVMAPEYIAYQNSPHARVKCVECHVGQGADWYVKSKMSGLYQVYSVLAHKYPTPIPTPLKNLRPARETCEVCHWPEKFYSRKLRVQKNFLADSANSEWDIYLQMKIGPQFSAFGLKEGIHWHINPDVKIEYVADDEKRENIVWVKYTNSRTGETHVYTNEENMPADSTLKNNPSRVMDCIDCHNRPSHIYKAPQHYVDNLMVTGRVAKEIPFIKKTAMEILKTGYGTKDSAFMALQTGITAFYKENYASFYASNQKMVDDAILAIEDGFSKNTFPEMKVSYDAYPDHIGHLESRGCFRCHNNMFKTDKGRVIRKDCNLCHTIIGQGNPATLQKVAVTDTLEFMHPVDIKGVWKTSDCSECHNYLFQ